MTPVVMGSRRDLAAQQGCVETRGKLFLLPAPLFLPNNAFHRGTSLFFGLMAVNRMWMSFWYEEEK